MSLMKDLYIEEHEKAIEKYLEDHPSATEAEAYDKTADIAYENLRDRLGDITDRAKKEAKDRIIDSKE